MELKRGTDAWKEMSELKMRQNGGMRGKSALGKDVWSLRACVVNTADNGLLKSQDLCDINSST